MIASPSCEATQPPTPMMTSRLFHGRAKRSGFAHWVDSRFRRVALRYEAMLTRVVAHPWRTLTLALLVLLAAGALFRVLPSAYAPPQDRG
ncbi:efflux RND transporter permease subunit, partial [Acinetobacter baumannii]|uniref:efflux RND transporter permease subunit n=1 Tax=Acinetobacter baumannii TaxID=470 RepID=UPI002091A21E